MAAAMFAGMQCVTRWHAIQSFGLALSHDTTMVEFGICGAVDWLHTIVSNHVPFIRKVL